jgi:hypothetical protein
VADLRSGVQQEEVGAAGGQVVPEGEAGLAGADHEDVVLRAVNGAEDAGHGISFVGARHSTWEPVRAWSPTSYAG